MLPIFRNILLLLAGGVFGGFLGLFVGTHNVGLGDTHLEMLFWEMTIVGGGAALLAAMAPGRSGKVRLILLLPGIILGAGSGALTALVMNERPPRPMEFAAAFTAWGGVFGLMCGWLKRATLLGVLAGLLIFNLIAMAGLYLGHPDPVFVLGVGCGLFVSMLLVAWERRPRMLFGARAALLGVVVVLAGGLLWLRDERWPKTEMFEVYDIHYAGGDCQIVFFADGERAISSHSHSAVVWRVEDGKVLGSVRLGSATVCDIVVSEKRPYLFATHHPQGVVRWEGTSGERILVRVGMPEFSPHEFRPDPLRMAASPDGKFAVVSDTSKGQLWLVDFEERFASPLFSRGLPRISALAWLRKRENQLLLVSEQTGGVYLVELEQRSFLQTVASKTWSPNIPNGSRIVLSPQESFACIYGGFDGALLLLCDLDNSLALTSLLDAGEGLLSAAFSADGKRILSAHQDDSVRLWDVAERRERRVYGHHASWVLEEFFSGGPVGVDAVAFSPDGKMGYSSTRSGQVRRWALGE